MLMPALACHCLTLPRFFPPHLVFIYLFSPPPPDCSRFMSHQNRVRCLLSAQVLPSHFCFTGTSECVLCNTHTRVHTHTRAHTHTHTHTVCMHRHPCTHMHIAHKCACTYKHFAHTLHDAHTGGKSGCLATVRLLVRSPGST